MQFEHGTSRRISRCEMHFHSGFEQLRIEVEPRVNLVVLHVQQRPRASVLRQQARVRDACGQQHSGHEQRRAG